jgi:hypothetical protein
MAIFERINRMKSGRSPSYDGESSASVATFEFDMDVVRDSRKQRKNLHGRKGLLGGGDSSERDRVSNERLDDMGEDEATGVPLLNSAPDDLMHSSTVFRSSSVMSESSGMSSILPSFTVMLSVVVGVLGIISSTLFLGFGIQNAVDDQEVMFILRANGLTQQFNRAWKEYMVASLWVHQACEFGNISRTDFENVYYYLNTSVDVMVSFHQLFVCCVYCSSDSGVHAVLIVKNN